MGFCVARTRNGSGSLRVSPSTVTLRSFIASRRAACAFGVADKLLDYVMEIVQRTRGSRDLVLGVSPRGAQGFFRAVQAHALVAGRPFATPDDVKKVAPAVLAHRILASATGRYEGTGAGRREREAVRKILEEVAVPL